MWFGSKEGKKEGRKEGAGECVDYASFIIRNAEE
jgi:hypothetical protein